MFKRISLLAISFSTLHAFAANSVAVIGQKTISAEEFKQRYEQNKALSLPGQAPSKEEVLSNIVNFELALQEAKSKGVDKDPMLKDQFEILMYKTLVQKEIKPKIDALNVPESEIKEYYEKSPLLRTRQIVFLTSPQMKNDDVQKVKARAQTAYDLITTGKKNFVDMVGEFSEGPDAKYGGLVEWSGRNKLVPEYYEAALALKEAGKISEIVETPYGFHIIQLEGIKPYSGLDTEYKNFIVRSLKDIKGRDVYEAYFNNLKKKYAVKTDLKNL